MTTAPAQSDRDEDGFTLVEMLVAITLFSLLSLLVISALRFGTASWQRGNAISAQIDETVQVQAMLRSLLGGAIPRFVPVPGGKGYVDFAGRPDAVSFLADPPRSLDRSGRLVMTLAADAQNARRDLALSVRPELSASGEEAAIPKRALLSGVEGVSFSYFGAKQHGTQPQWHATWEKEMRLPDLIRIELRLMPNAGRNWPETVIAPRIDVDVSCTYDTLTRGCRGR